MDKPTRNLIQKATQDARHLLETEFSRQLEGVFDILPDGTVAPEPGEHLDPAQKVIRRKIVAAIEHEKASGMSDREAVAAYLREASFTCLNRFTALKMLEARGLTLECVSRGEQSSGFKEFCGLAPGLSELPDRGYRLYIESLFDELSTEVRVLFDRRHPASLLWPSGKVLKGLLSVLNRYEIREIWKEDETIGWVYQYFNIDADRQSARYDENGKPKSPQNTHELAVRNQFFTPRYVVEFLTDNTLGRIWYEMRQGQTGLKEACRYLVRQPDEVFLDRETADDCMLWETGRLLQEGDETTFPEFTGQGDGIIRLAHCVDGYKRHPMEEQVGGVWWPFWRKKQIEDGEPVEDISTQDLMDILFGLARADRQGGDGGLLEEPATLKMANEIRRRVVTARREDLSQEELLRMPAFVPFRAKKDPRDIRVLDPACGSGHFLLYAFDLLEQIYEEAWADPGSPFSEATGRSLQKDYESVEALRAAIPKLIIEHNLHGIDIDPRAVQIAVLAIWLRAQKAWKGFGVKAGERPRVVKSNIVTAEPMPGEEGMRREFIEGLQPRVLGQLAEIVFEKMELAGEAGLLLKVEHEMKAVVAEAKC